MLDPPVPPPAPLVDETLDPAELSPLVPAEMGCPLPPAPASLASIEVKLAPHASAVLMPSSSSAVDNRKRRKDIGGDHSSHGGTQQGVRQFLAS
jgi:hypothetical protein